MPWILVDQDGLVPNVETPEWALRVARDHAVEPQDLAGKTQGETWTVTF